MGLLTKACSTAQEEMEFMKQGRFILDTRKKFFTVRVVKH